jgi:energy-converting hydrogenase Eha subunit E
MAVHNEAVQGTSQHITQAVNAELQTRSLSVLPLAWNRVLAVVKLL